MKRILYVDDEEINLMIFEKLFEKYFQIDVSSRPLSALESIKSENYDAIISDMKMPVLNGLELVNEARKIKPHIPYYILSAFSYNSDIQKALDENVIKGFFKKPIDLKIIKSEIDSLS